MAALFCKATQLGQEERLANTRLTFDGEANRRAVIESV
jgi:hypothetical protein